MQNNGLPIGFITMDEAIKLINDYKGAQSDDDPFTVPQLDITGMLQRHRWIQPTKNFCIYFTVYTRNRAGKLVKKNAGISKYVSVQDAFEAEALKRALVNKFRELSGREFDMSTTLRSVTTSVDPDDPLSGKPRQNAHPVASVGDQINTAQQVINGENV